MTIRDLGYRPYEGDRLPASHNTIVLLRHGMSRAWGSWLVKIAVIAGWLPSVVTVVIVGGLFYLAQRSGQDLPEEFDAASVVRGLFTWQLWLFVTMITLGGGAGVIAQDLRYKAFQFYFAKPVLPMQYLVGRVGAVAFWCFLITFGPALLVVLALTGTSPAEVRLERAALLLPALIYSGLISLVVSVGSVGMSALSRSRAVTMSAWLLLFAVPHVVGALVYGVTSLTSEEGDGWEWLLLLSIPKLLGTVADALFKVQAEGDITWGMALPLLAGVVAGGAWLSLHRLRTAEVIT